ncbi:MAG TPA: divalent metal cation transporter [bacterium]|nr:divalent metal cation transporter [bacterium]
MKVRTIHLGRKRPGPGAREHRVRAAHSWLVRCLSVLGPGIIAGASDDDPSGVATYAVAGASLGLGTLWTALFTIPMTAAVQFISAKIGLVSGHGLAGALRRRYPAWAVWSAVLGLAVANTINAGADIGAVAAAFNLMVPVPIAVMIVPVAAGILAVVVWGTYPALAGALKWMSLLLLAYVGSAFVAQPNWSDVLVATVVPRVRLDGQFLAVLVAVLGTTISPYMWFWQASQEVEERLAIGERRLWQRRGVSRTELGYAAWDVDVGMVFSNVVMYFIILATAATLHRTGHTNITSAAQAAAALRPLAGPLATWLFAIGLASAGLIAIPVLTGSAAYAIADLFGWRAGLGERPRRARWFYAAIAASTGIGMVLNFTGINPINALFVTAVINGFLTPPMLVLVMLASNNREIMGSRVNGPLLNGIGWVTTAVMTAAVVGLILTWRS